MAAVAGTQLVNISINGEPLQVPKGEMIVESIKRLGLDVPIFCYHPRMAPVGMCRMCLVETGTKGPDGSIRMMPKPQTACSLPATEGLVINTDTEKIHQDRKGVLEFLLINHPLDCPICDRGGECPLQNNTLFYGPSTSRYVEVKRHAPKAFPLSQHVTLDLERCIQCGRCVRFTEEISGDGQLAFRFRGASMQPSTFELRDFTSKFSGNTIEICPVGALTSSDYRFRARPWDLQTRPSICTNCGNGCNVFFDYRGSHMVRISGRTNEEVNEEWTCDKGKFGHEFYNSERRLLQVLIRSGDNLAQSDWPQAYALIARTFVDAGGSVAAIGGSRNSNEDVFMFQRLFRAGFGSKNLDHRVTKNLKPGDAPGKPSSIASFEDRKAILLFGTNLADEEPILYLRIRKAWLRNGAKIVVAHRALTEADDFAEISLTCRPGTEADLAAAFAKGSAANLDATAAKCGLDVAVLAQAIEVLGSLQPAVVATDSLLNQENGLAALNSLRKAAETWGGSFDCYGLRANDAGAGLLGMLPDEGMDTHQILKGCIDGTVKALWLLGLDLFDADLDRDFIIQALENVPFLVVQDLIETDAMGYASVVLPMTAPAESEGTWTNIENRVQKLGQILLPKGSAKPAWLAASDLLMRLKGEPPVYNAPDVMGRIVSEIPAYAGCSYEKLMGSGYVLGS